MWKTIREVDINAIRHEADRGVAIVCIGQPAALWWVERYLRDGPNRYPLSADPLALVPLAEAADYLGLVGSADLLVVALDAATPLDGAEQAGLQRLSTAPRPSQVVLLFGAADGRAVPVVPLPRPGRGYAGGPAVSDRGGGRRRRGAQRTSR